MNKAPAVHLSLVDRAINYFNPRGGLERIKAKAALSGLEATGFIVPGSRRRSMRAWNPKANQADEDILKNLDKLRAGSRDLYMNSPLATGAIRRISTNAVGSGLTLQSQVDRRFLGLSDDAADDWERTVEREFSLWAESKNCDATKTQNFYELQALAITSQMLSGEVFATIPLIETSGFPYQTALKLIEADMVCNPQDNQDTAQIAGGIELDGNGAPKKYWFKIAPYGGFANPTWTGVPAFGSNTGRRNVLHLFERERPGQRRGYPLLAPVMESLKQLTRLSESELMASVVSSFFTVFVKSTTGNGLAEGYVPDENVIPRGTDGEATEDEDKPIYEMGPASIIELGDDEDISIADPKRPNEAFEPFFLAVVKQIGSAIELPFEQLLLHFQASYSASRAALLEAWKFYRKRRTWLAANFCQPVYEEWLMEAVIVGRVEAPGFFEDPAIARAWAGSAWIGPGQGQIDPIRETRAALLRIKGNIASHSEEYTAIKGGNWEGMAQRLSRENQLLEDSNLVSVQAQSSVSEGTDLR